MNNPCKGCEKRYSGCHSDCEEYKAWRAEMNKKNDAIKEYRKAWGLTTEDYRRHK